MKALKGKFEIKCLKCGATDVSVGLSHELSSRKLGGDGVFYAMCRKCPTKFETCLIPYN